jgi:hypothetical protein
MTKKQTTRILSMFNRGITSARTISTLTNIPRRQVMRVLEQNNKTRYSSGSYL